MTTIEMPSARSRRAIVLALCLAAFIISVDVTIVNVALPTLVRTLGASTTELQWVVDAYSLVFAALVLAAGSLSDRQGRKGTLLIGLAVFASGSLAGALVSTTQELIAARAVMGLGAALMFPSTLSLLVGGGPERGEGAKAIGLWGATTGVGIASRPNRRGLVARALLVGKHLRLHGPRRRGGRGPRRHSGPDLAGPADATYRLVRPGAVERRHGDPRLRCDRGTRLGLRTPRRPSGSQRRHCAVLPLHRPRESK